MYLQVILPAPESTSMMAQEITAKSVALTALSTYSGTEKTV